MVKIKGWNKISKGNYSEWQKVPEGNWGIGVQPKTMLYKKIWDVYRWGISEEGGHKSLADFDTQKEALDYAYKYMRRGSINEIPKGWKKASHSTNSFVNDRNGRVVSIEKADGLFYVREYNASGFLCDSLAEKNMKNAKKSANTYMKNHIGDVSFDKLRRNSNG